MNLIQTVLTYSTVVKVLLGTFLVTVVAGPGVLYFVSQYATYWYAIEQNVRPPVEGVPYLYSVVALGGLFVAAVAFLVFLITRLILALLFKLIIGVLNLVTDVYYGTKNPNLIESKVPNYFSNMRKLAKEGAYKVMVSYSLSAAVISYFIALFDDKSTTISFEIFLVVFVWVWCALYTLWKPALLWVLGISMSLLVYGVAFYSIFNVTYYEKMLVTLKYGGGIPIEVEFRDKKKLNINADLVIRTNSSLLLRGGGAIDSKEIFLNDVSSIKYISKKK